ncbi:MAG: Radical domain protein [Symbiobacteriaceae bacterium]|jgi:cyclic dehypoxanthinyl futalosine synthase|nr:Radical domain protein [Symbiobacteriaceae bacterium]
MNLNFMDTSDLLRKALSGEKLFPDEAIYLCAEGDLLNLAMAGREVARRLHSDGQVGYAVTKTIVYSNVCQPECPFCTGTVSKDDPAAFTKSVEAVVAEAAEAVAAGATQITLQGGHRIDLPWDYYIGLVTALHERFPDLQIFAFSPTEIMVFNVLFQKRTSEVIAELKAAGMGGLIAGGSETMATRAPEYRALLRGPWNEWFDVVHRCADAGIPVVLPFVFGLGEAPKERVGHLYRSRAVQERTSLAGKPAFAAMSVFTLTPPEGVLPATGHEYLRMVALARVLLQNVPHVQASVVAQGAKVAQVALDSGANDLGGTHMEFTQAELAAGRVGPMTPTEMERLITDAGRVPLQRPTW